MKITRLNSLTGRMWASLRQAGARAERVEGWLGRGLEKLALLDVRSQSNLTLPPKAPSTAPALWYRYPGKRMR